MEDKAKFGGRGLTATEGEQWGVGHCSQAQRLGSSTARYLLGQLGEQKAFEMGKGCLGIEESELLAQERRLLASIGTAVAASCTESGAAALRAQGIGQG